MCEYSYNQRLLRATLRYKLINYPAIWQFLQGFFLSLVTCLDRTIVFVGQLAKNWFADFNRALQPS